MEALDLLSKENLNTESISLEFSPIVNLAQILPKLGQFKRLKELSLHGTKLKSLPEDLSVLGSLELLDISNNLFRDLQAVIGLRTLPRLKSLIIDLRGKEDEDAFIKLLPRLEEINGKPIKVNPFEAKQNESRSFDQKENSNLDESELGIKKDDLEAVGLLFQLIKELFNERGPDQDETLLEQFDDHVSRVLQDLTSKLGENTVNAFKMIQVLRAKYDLYEICFIKVIELIARLDPRVSSILEGLHDAHKVIFKDLANNVADFNKAGNGHLGKSDSQADPIDTAELLEAAENLEKENQKLRADKESIIEAHRQEREELMEQIASLQEENAKYLDTIVRHSKGNVDQSLGRLPTSYSQELNGNKNFGDLSDRKNYESVNEANGQQSAIRPNINMMNPANVYLTQVGVRALTLKQLKDVIEDIYSSKTKYDQRCHEAKLPRETMEQHMYTYLNQRYGLKNLIIEWATAIVNGIKKFSGEDNDVAVFGKILRNECDEDFRNVQAQVKVTIVELLKMYLRSKYPLKNNAEIKEMLNVRINDTVQEEECVDIIKYMYNEEDSEVLLMKLKKYYTNPPKVEGKKLSREEQLKLQSDREKPIISFTMFQKIILDFQLKSHEKFLKNFISIFRTVDKDLNGIIDENEFKKLVSDMEKYSIQPDTEKLLMNIDPYAHQQITFSQCVAVFSAEQISDGESTFSILQKISLEN